MKFETFEIIIPLNINIIHYTNLIRYKKYLAKMKNFFRLSVPHFNLYKLEKNKKNIFIMLMQV